MKKVIVYEIKEGILTGSKFETNDKDFSLDLKLCAKTYINGGVKVFVDFNKYKELCK